MVLLRMLLLSMRVAAGSDTLASAAAVRRGAGLQLLRHRVPLQPNVEVEVDWGLPFLELHAGGC